MRMQNLMAAYLIIAASPALAAELSPQEAIEFVPGKWWRFSCNVGVRGIGLVQKEDGCVVAKVESDSIFGAFISIWEGGTKFLTFPAGTINIVRSSDGTPSAICTTQFGFGLRTCFTVNKISDEHFFGYRKSRPQDKCDFRLTNAPSIATLPSREQSRCSAVP